jgi:GntR family transcriptional regulator
VLDEIWLPAVHFKGLTRDMLTAWRGPLYGFFESRFGICMASATERIKAVAADEQHAQSLGVPAGSPLLYVERLSRAFGDKPVELRRGWYVTDVYHYKNVLS